MVITVLLLAPALGLKSAWIDEGIGLSIARQDSIADAYEQYRSSDYNQPLNGMLIYGWTRIAGKGDTATRIPYVALSVACVGLMVAVARRLTNKRTALIAGYVMATSPFLLLFGRMSLYYIPTLFLTLTSVLTLLIAFQRSAEEGRRSRVWWVLHAVSLLALLMTNFTAIAYIAVEAIFGLLIIAGKASIPGSDHAIQPSDRRRLLWTWAVTAGVAMILFALWLSVEGGRVLARDLSPRPFEVLGLARLALDAAYPIYSWSVGPTLFPWHLAALVAGAAAVVGLILGLIRVASDRKSYFLIGLGFIGALLITVVVYQTYVRARPFETVPTRAILVYPFFLLTLAFGLDRLSKRLLAAALVALTIGSAFGAYNYFTGRQFHNAIYTVPSREIARTILERARPGDVVVAETDTMVPYYFLDLDDAPCLLAVSFFRRGSEARTISELEDDPPKRIWMVSLGRDGTQGLLSGDLRRWVDANYDQRMSRGYVPQDPTYARIKERLQGGQGYRFKATLQLLAAEPGLRPHGTPSCDFGSGA